MLFMKSAFVERGRVTAISGLFLSNLEDVAQQAVDQVVPLGADSEYFRVHLFEVTHRVVLFEGYDELAQRWVSRID